VGGLKSDPESRQTRSDGDCPCGWGGYHVSEMKHATKHLQWDEGIKLPSAMVLHVIRAKDVSKGSALVVPWAAPHRERRLAYEMARLAQREAHYDFPSFTRPYGRSKSYDAAESEETALLWCTWQRCLGYAVVDRVSRWGAYPFETHPRGEPIKIDSHQDSRWRIGLIWVAHGRRREGIGSALIAEVARISGGPASELVWQGPFTDAGLGLAKRFAQDGLIYIG
jgi:ribosomal protein S18 acetylase RimI-like enzyme